MGVRPPQLGARDADRPASGWKPFGDAARRSRRAHPPRRAQRTATTRRCRRAPSEPRLAGPRGSTSSTGRHGPTSGGAGAKPGARPSSEVRNQRRLPSTGTRDRQRARGFRGMPSSGVRARAADDELVLARGDRDVVRERTSTRSGPRARRRRTRRTPSRVRRSGASLAVVAAIRRPEPVIFVVTAARRQRDARATRPARRRAGRRTSPGGTDADSQFMRRARRSTPSPRPTRCRAARRAAARRTACAGQA